MIDGNMRVNKPMTDKTLHCVDCSATFLFSTGEQRYFSSKGLSVPKRCPECQKRRRNNLVRDDAAENGY